VSGPEEGLALASASAIRPGDRLPDLVRTPTRVTCFLFAVAWWAPHRVHYDVELAREEGYVDVMVPGLLLNEYVVSAVTSWTGDPTTLRKMTIRNTAPVFAGDTVKVESEVTAVRKSESIGGVTHDRVLAITFEYKMTKGDGQPVASGSALVEVPLPAA
jgi:acyl dehydratase